MKLYLIYSVVSNKTVRQKENFKRVFKRNSKYVLGQLVRTNRGYFIDGRHVDLKAVETWHFLNDPEHIEAAKLAVKNWKEYLRSLKEKEQ